MKKILFFLLSAFCFLSSFAQINGGNDTSKYIWYKNTYGNKLQRYWATDVLDIPLDSTHSKTGFAKDLTNWPMWGDTTRWYKFIKSTTTNLQPGDEVRYDANGDLYNQTPSPSACNNASNITASYVSGLTYAHTAGTYTINCIQYTLTSGTLTHDAGTAGTGEFRFDVEYLDDTGIHILKGDNSSGGVGAIPEVTAGQLELLVVRIDENNTAPTGPASTTVYNENIEWTTGTGGTITAAFNYGTNPEAGSLSTRITAAANNAYFQYTNSTTVSKATFTNLQIWVRNNNSFSAARNWVVRLYNTNTQVGNTVNLTAWGYSKTAVGAWQLVSIPMSAFGGADAFNRVRILNTGTGGIVDVQFDNIALQSGIIISNPPPVTVAPSTFASVAELRASNTYTQGTVYANTLGYYSASSGGGALYIWSGSSTATDNGGTVLKPDALSAALPGRWLMSVINHTVDIKQFGAKGDGITDDRAAIIAAYNALPLVQIANIQYTKGILLFPQCDSAYYISDSLLFSYHLNIEGLTEAEFPFATIKINVASGKSGLVFKQGISGGEARAVYVKNIGVFALGSSEDTTKNGVFSNSLIHMENVHAENFGGNGITINTTSYGNANISHCDNCSGQGNGLDGLLLTGGESSQISIINPDFQFNGRSNIHDNGFLGSTGLGGHTSGPGMRVGHTSDAIASRGGHYYVCKVYNINKEPTVAGDWQDYWEDVGTSIEVPSSIAAWNSGTTYHPAANLELSGDAQGGTWTGLYCEGGTGGNIVKGGNLVINGQGSYTWNGQGVQVKSADGYFEAFGGGVRVRKKTDLDRYAILDTDFGSLRIGDLNTGGSGWAQSIMTLADSTVAFMNSNSTTPTLMFPGTSVWGGRFGITGSQLSGLPIVNKFGLFFTDVTEPSLFGSVGYGGIGGMAMGHTYPFNEGLKFRKGFIVWNIDASANDTLAWVANTETTGGVSGEWDRILKSGGGGGGGSTLLGLTGSNTATGDVTGDISSHTLSITGTSGSYAIGVNDGTNQAAQSISAGVTEISSIANDNSSGATLDLFASSGAVMTLLGTSTFTGGAGDSTNYSDDSYAQKGAIKQWIANAVAGAGGISGSGVSGRNTYWSGTGSITSSSAWLFDGTDKLTLSGSDIRSSSGNWLRLSPTNGALQVFTSGASNNITVYNSGGSDGLTLDGPNRSINSAGTTTSIKLQTGSGIVGIGSGTPDASAKLDINTTTQGFLPPRMTTTQRDAISSPATGLIVFCTDCTASDASTGVNQTYNGSTWKNWW